MTNSSFGIILQSNKPEHVWNAFRFDNAALKAGHAVEWTPYTRHAVSFRRIMRDIWANT